MDDETFQALRRVDWGEVGTKLLAVAINYAQKYSSIGYQTCDDIVQDVIVKTLRGERYWDPKRGELLPWLKWCVKSEIDNSAKKLTTKNELLLTDQDDDKDSFDAALDIHSTIVSVSENLSNPETVLLQQEMEATIRQEISQIYKTVEGEEELEDLVLAMGYLIDESEAADQPSRPELAEYLSIPKSEIDNRMKRLRRLLLKVRVS